MLSTVINFSRVLVTLKTTKRWWIPVIILVIVLVNMAGFLLPKKYEAKASVKIHTPKEMMGTVSGLLNVGDQIKAIREIITGPAFLEKIARKVNLDAGIAPNTPQYERLINKMKAAIELRVKETDLFEVSYKSTVPEQAQRVAKAIVDDYIEMSNRYSEDVIRKSEATILGELTDARLQRDQAQKEITKYKNDNINFIPEARESLSRQISERRNSRQAAGNQLGSLESSLLFAKEKLSRMAEETVSERTTGQSSELQTLRKQRADAEVRLNLLRQKFEDKHWDVQQALAEVTQIDKMIKETEATQVEKITKTPNKAYQDLQFSILQEEMMAKKLQSQVQKEDQEIARLDTFLNEIPKHEAEIARRQSALARAEDHVAQLESYLYKTRMTGAVDQKGLGPSFEILFYPRVPKVPVSPNRKKIGALSVALGLAAGAALVYLLTLLDSAVRSVEEARRMLQMPVLGVMQRIVTAGEELRRRRRHHRRLAGASASLLLLVAMVVAGFMYRESLQKSLETARNIISQW